MFRKLFLVKSVFVLCVLVVAMVLVGGCEPIPTPLPVSDTLQIGSPILHESGVTSVAFSPDGKTLATSTCAENENSKCVLGEILLWNVNTHHLIGQPLAGHDNFVGSIAFSPNGRTLASTGFDGTIIFWDVNARRPIGQPLRASSKPGRSISFSPDGKILASASLDGTVILWNVNTHQRIGEALTWGSSQAWGIAFSPDGKRIAVAYDRAILLWDVNTRLLLGQPFGGHTDTIYSVAFSPDGKTLASGSWDKTVILWDVSNPQSVSKQSVLRGHKNYVFNVAFSPQGNLLASTSSDQSIILWDVNNIQSPIQLRTLQGHYSWVRGIAFSPNGKTLASSDDAKTAILWDITNPRAPTPSPLSASSIQSISQEIVQYLSTKSVPGGVIARTEEGRIVQVWDVEQNSEVPRNIDPRGVWNRAQPSNMSPCRVCSLPGSVETTTRFEVKSSTHVTAELCVSDMRLTCDYQELGKIDGKWQVMNTSREVSSICHCR